MRPVVRAVDGTSTSRLMHELFLAHSVLADMGDSIYSYALLPGKHQRFYRRSLESGYCKPR